MIEVLVLTCVVILLWAIFPVPTGWSDNRDPRDD